MFQIAIIPNNTDANLSLCYKTEADCRAVYDRIMKPKNGLIREKDDYGNELAIGAASISYVLFIDVAKSQEREFDQNMCVNKKREEFDKKLRDMGYMPQQVKKPSIIQ